MQRGKRIHRLTFIMILVVLTFSPVQAGTNVLSIQGDQILYNDKPIKILGLRCSNALISDQTTQDLIGALDLYKSYGLNTVSVFFMGSRFGDIKGYHPDGSLDSTYCARMERILQATDDRNMVLIVGGLYWGTSRAKEELAHWTQKDANKAIANTAKWLKEKGFTHIILDPDNEGMAVERNEWNAEQFIKAAKTAHPNLIVANNTKTDPPNEDLNIHFGNKEKGKPWFDSESTPTKAPGNYWERFSRETHDLNSAYHNYSRIGRYTSEMKQNHIDQTVEEMENYNGYMFAGTWIQCGPLEGINGPFVNPGGYSNLGSSDDETAAWNTDIDTIHPDSGILWWLEFVRDKYGDSTTQ